METFTLIKYMNYKPPPCSGERVGGLGDGGERAGVGAELSKGDGRLGVVPEAGGKTASPLGEVTDGCWVLFIGNTEDKNISMMGVSSRKRLNASRGSTPRRAVSYLA